MVEPFPVLDNLTHFSEGVGQEGPHHVLVHRDFVAGGAVSLSRHVLCPDVLDDSLF